MSYLLLIVKGAGITCLANGAQLILFKMKKGVSLVLKSMLS